MTDIETKAYTIGISTAKKERAIVPAARSVEMLEFMEEQKTGLLNLIKAYDAGMAYEICRQAKLELKIDD